MSVLSFEPFTFDIFYYKEKTAINSEKYYFFNEPNEKTKKLVVKALNSEWDKMSVALEEATFINHINGSRFLRTKTFFEYILNSFILELIFEDEDPPEVMVNGTFGMLNYKLVREIVKTWLINT